MRRTFVLTVAAVVVLGLAACSSSSGKPISAATTGSPNVKAAIGAWFNGGGESRITAVSTDANTAATASSNLDATALRAGCSALQKDVESAQAYAPIPDAQMQSAWSSALAQYARAATDCVAGVDGMDATVISRAASELGAGAKFLDQATARAQELSGG